jgi:voltage-gated potassium channel
VRTRTVIVLLLLPILFLTIGTLGYRLIEGPPWTWLDALYMSAITLTTVGYLEVHPLSPAGRVFTIVLCMTGVFTLFFTAGKFIRAVISGEFRKAIGRQLMERNLAALRSHTIVCGLGRMGRLVCRQFEDEKVPYVVIEQEAGVIDAHPAEAGLTLHGDATSDEILRLAGVERARALVAVVGSDADNLYITLSARLLNARLFIVARAEEKDAEMKLRRAGADQVVSPYVIGGFRIAQAVIRPSVVDFIEMATRTDYLEMQIEEVRLRKGSRLVGQTLAECRIHQDLGLIVVAVKTPEGKMVSNPSGDTTMAAEQTLIVLGHRQQLDELEKLAVGG